MSDKLYPLTDIMKFLRSQDTIEDAIENLNEENVAMACTYEDEKSDDDSYQDAWWNMDKYMNDEDGVSEEFDEILHGKEEPLGEDEKRMKIREFIELYCIDEDRMESYFPVSGSIDGFVDYLMRQTK